MHADTREAGDAPVKLACRGLWKVFGEHADRVLERSGGAPDAATLARHGLTAAVRDASLDVHTGEVFVIMGLSGSGKSTLVRCLSRLVEPSLGALTLEDRDLLAAPERELTEIRRHQMGMVFQHFALLPHRDVLGNVAFPLEIQGIGRDERERRAREMIELVGLDGYEARRPAALSGGQQQRVGIARSLAVDPELWFLDEPFSALDPLIRREMQDELLRLQRVLHKTVIFITHDFDEAIRLADRVAIMKAGEIVQVDTPERLVLSPADDYVAEFTRHVPTAKVVGVSSVMRHEDTAPAGAAEVGADERIEAVAPRVLAAGTSLRVRDPGSGRVVGTIGRDEVIAVLAGTGGGHE
ncbi:Glycine betaine transport ATP-binding protein OpuAA [wastewater metagenome]|uniref:Glycine betaine transport ATP-binding protein OpuAA n=2 Tax=unclassified sequences TaxID=12908 RepID=A0A5B8RBH1_9ZZZZ|nr:betaine/proline/choline family ABC transporter ATP-binding protein [Arhodomonas sp. KWT]QEA06046.1 glycine betaine transport ATP-binding protein OpuAA [uncultured organism]